MKDQAISPVFLRVTRSVRIPDPVKLARYEKNPELGPQIMFFSGGNALKNLSRKLIRFTHNSIHIITPFDSGGSSAELRRAFRMPAVGDIRNRLMALADQTFQGNPEIVALFAYRLSKEKPVKELRDELDYMVRGKNPLVAGIPDPMRKIIRNHLHSFLDAAPESFDLKGASIGNLILTAGYLGNRRMLDPVIYIFSKLARVRGVVRPVVNKYLHLVAELESGRLIIGQHHLSSPKEGVMDSPVKTLFLSENDEVPKPVQVHARQKIRQMIQSADLICYPIGSFYSSVIANLLPVGIGEAVSMADCPKIYVPNMQMDPEAFGLEPAGQIEILLSYLKAGISGKTENRRVLDMVLVDQKRGVYGRPIDKKRIASLGIDLIDYPLVSRHSSPYIDPERLTEALLSLT